jgi:adenylate kinase
MRMVLIGAPGSGKGTQAALLVARFHIPHVSTGDMFRAAVAEKTELGKKAYEFMKSGQLVPDEMVIPMALERLAKRDAQKGFILDGFPRTHPQAEELDGELKKHHVALNFVVVIDVPDGLILERNIGRRSDPVTGIIYHMRFNPPPPEVAARVVQRKDDREDAITARLAKYHAEAESICSFYQDQGILRRVDGIGTPGMIGQRVVAALQ